MYIETRWPGAHARGVRSAAAPSGAPVPVTSGRKA